MFLQKKCCQIWILRIKNLGQKNLIKMKLIASTKQEWPMNFK